ncbi:MAG: hypothetical protein H0T39_09550 [Actinobacteria bacterium]|nr:hypothetical protein [Actinomycetota bacterium]
MTYYGSYGSTRYAIATFSREGVGTTDQPELFSKPSGKPWRDRGDTGGCISSSIIPSALLRLWGSSATPSTGTASNVGEPMASAQRLADLPQDPVNG